MGLFLYARLTAELLASALTAELAPRGPTAAASARRFSRAS